MGRDNRAKIKDVFLALVMLAGEMTGVVLCVVTMLLQKRLLPAWLETAYMVFGGIIWLGLMPVCFCLWAAEKGEGWQRVKRYWLETLKWELWLLAAYGIWRLADRGWLTVWQRFFRSEALYGVVYFLLILAAVFAGGLLIHKMLRSCGLGRRVSGAAGVLITSSGLYVALATLQVVSVYMDRIFQRTGPSVVSMLAGHVFMACCAYGAMRLFMWVVCEEGNGVRLNQEAADQPGCESGQMESVPEQEAMDRLGSESGQAESVPEQEAMDRLGSESGQAESAPEQEAMDRLGGESGQTESAPDQEAADQSRCESNQAGNAPEQEAMDRLGSESGQAESAPEQEAMDRLGSESGQAESVPDQEAADRPRCESDQAESAPGQEAADRFDGESTQAESVPGQEAADRFDGESTQAGNVPEQETVAQPGGESARAAVGNADKGTAGDSPASGSAGMRTALGAGIPLVLAIVSFIITGIINGNLSFSTVTNRAASAVEECIQKGYACLEEGNFAQAAGQFALAQARAQALECLAGEEADERTLGRIYDENSNDVFIGTLYLSKQNAMTTMEKKVRGHVWGQDWYPALLRFYGEFTREEERELSLRQENLREELLLECIANEFYSGDGGLFAQDLEGDEPALRKRLDDFGEELALCGLFGLMEQYGAAGGYTEELAYQALEMAEKNPNNLLLQYMACQIAGNYQADKAEHYERTIEAARRFDRLYDDGSRTDEELADAKRFLGKVAANCYDYETALLFLKDVWELSGDAAAALSCARLYERSGKYMQCLEMAQDVLDEEPENTQALYLVAISALKTEDRDRALDAAGRLGDLVADRDRPLNAAEENNLYVCAQYLAMEDAGRWTDYTWQIYGSLTEEQIASAQSHELLWHYMTGIYQCFMKREYAAAEEAVRKALELREDLAMGWYLRGTIAFNMEEFEEAQSYFQKALECGGVSPAIYFSLANVCDAMEDYENAWLYAKRVEEMLPYQDHGNDVYGISVHNKNLLALLGKKLGIN